jgi:hypothetical protein
MTDENVPFEPESAVERLQAYYRLQRLDGVLNSIRKETEHERRAYWSYREAIIWAVWRNWAAVPFMMDGGPVTVSGGAPHFLYALGEAVLVHVAHPTWNTIEMPPEGADALLIGALREGGLVAFGAREGDPSQREIPTHEWARLSTSAYFWRCDDDQGGWARLSNGDCVWGDLLFKRSDIERLFPPIGADGVEVAEAVESEVAPVAVVDGAGKVSREHGKPISSEGVKTAANWLRHETIAGRTPSRKDCATYFSQPSNGHFTVRSVKENFPQIQRLAGVSATRGRPKAR